MVIAVISVGMMQMTIHQVIDMVAVRNRLVTAIRTMFVILRVSVTGMFGRAGGRVASADAQTVLLNRTTLGMVQVAVMQIVDVAVMDDPGMPAIGPVLVRVALVNLRHF
jgi:hypothetical protein